MNKFFQSLNYKLFAMAVAVGAMMYFLQDSGKAIQLWACVYFAVACMFMMELLMFQYTNNTLGLKTMLDKLPKLNFWGTTRTTGDLAWLVVSAIILLSPIGTVFVLFPIAVVCSVTGQSAEELIGFIK